MLKEKTALVTGGAKGIGRAICLEFAKNGANVAINYRSTIDENFIKELESFGVKVKTYKWDVRDFEVTKEMVEVIKQEK